jgi:hypothetical protein
MSGGWGFAWANNGRALKAIDAKVWMRASSPHAIECEAAPPSVAHVIAFLYKVAA